MASEIDTAFAFFARHAHQQLRALEDLELGVDGSGPGRIAKLVRQVLDADEPVSVGDCATDLDPILRATEERARQLSDRVEVQGIRTSHYVLRIMDQGAWIKLLAHMIAAGGVSQLPARTPWPMHRALRLLYAEASRTGRLRLLPPAPTFAPCPETGIAAVGADEALRALIRSGSIREVGAGLDATLVVDQGGLVQWRRSLMGRDPRAVAMLQRAGERWAALASTAENTRAMPAESVGGAVTSATA